MESNATFLMCAAAVGRKTRMCCVRHCQDVQSGSDVKFCLRAAHLGDNSEAEVINTQVLFLWFSHKALDTQALYTAVQASLYSLFAFFFM